MLVTEATFQSPMLPYVFVAVVGLVVQAATADLMSPSVMGVRWAAAMGNKISSSRAGLGMPNWREARRGEGIEDVLLLLLSVRSFGLI